ncbi:replication protein A 70 kDa DNA-binding subunit-like [Corticium candelabrum]|uniref:replication protein A 70 kDa DNA-binding subunit-like n=1 Tax=Corticium candelabrum TaxID=121492 RepID=UPI002E2734AD|nr:replication protein A 70 kDa DNA-binding subunit-like [Corticium candelabrum]
MQKYGMFCECVCVPEVVSRMAFVGENRTKQQVVEESNGAHYSCNSDEDTEEASETDIAKGDQDAEAREDYQLEKQLQIYKEQLQQLRDGTNPDYLRRVSKLEKAMNLTIACADAFHDYQLGIVEREYLQEKEAVKKEFEIKKVELKENLIHELEEEKKKIEMERQTMEMTGDTSEVKPVITRKLRRRPNDPPPAQDKRPKRATEISQLLDEEDIMDDLRVIFKGHTFPNYKRTTPAVPLTTSPQGFLPEQSANVALYDARIDENKLIYERKVYQRGQQIILESKETGKVNCVIHTVGQAEIIVKKNMDQMKLRIFLSQLRSGKYIIRKRPNCAGQPHTKAWSPMFIYIRSALDLSSFICARSGVFFLSFVAMAHMLSAGAIQAVVQGQQPANPVLQILNMKKIQGNNSGGSDRFRMIVADGKQSLNAMLATQLNPMVVNNEVERFAVFRLSRYVTNEVNGRRVIIILGLDVLEKGSQVNKVLGNPESDNLKGNQSSVQHQPPPQATRPNQSMQGGSTGMGGKPSSGPQNQYGGGFGQRPPQQTTMVGMNRPAQSFPASVASNSHPTSALSPTSKRVFPIRSLNPYQNKWTFRARVTNKTSVRTWNNSRGDGKVFSVDLLDESDEIRATAFNELVDKFYDLLEKGKVYYISRGSIKTANKKYTSIKNDYELYFSHDTVIEPCMDECSMPKMVYDFVDIKKIEDIPKDSVIDVIGVVKSVSDIVQITAKSSGRQISKRDVQLMDRTGAVNGTLWGDDAESFSAPANAVVAVRGARVSEFGGRSLSLSSGGSIAINPDHAAAHQLRGWYETEGGRSDVKSISGNQMDMNRPSQFKRLCQIKDENLGHGDKPDYLSVRATAVFFKKDNCLYKACPLEDQNYKVVDLGNGQYQCERLNRTFDSFKWRYILQVNISDFTGEQWITCFSEAADAMIGYSAQALGELKESNESSFDQVFADANFAMYNLKLRAKVDTYNDEQRVKCTCVSVSPLNFREESKKLIDEIKRLQQL